MNKHASYNDPSLMDDYDPPRFRRKPKVTLKNGALVENLILKTHCFFSNQITIVIM